MDIIRTLSEPALVARIQQFFGVELIKPGTCDQQTQTKRLSSGNSDQTSSNDIVSCDSQTATGTQCRHISLEKCPVCGQDNSANCEINSASGIILSSTRQRGEKCKGLELNNNGINGNVTTFVQTCPDVSKCLKGERIDDERNGRIINFCDSKAPVNTDDRQSTVTCSSFCETSQTNGTEPAFKIKYKTLFYLAHFGALLGNEEFYLTFYPFFLWNVDSLVVRQVGLLWCLIMYLGQATKDYLKWPRPQCPPVVRLETAYIQEFSMPSTHAMAGTAIPMYMAYLAVVRYQVAIPVAATVAVLWYSTTCFSRLYLGVHTVLDLIVGTLYAVILFATFMAYVEDYDLYQQTHPLAPIMIITTALLMCFFFYPNSDKNLSSKGDTVQIVATVAGCSFGAWVAYQLEYTHYPEILRPYEIQVPSLTWFSLSMLRFFSGLIILGVSYITIKKSSIQSFSYLYGLNVPDKTNLSVLTAYKFTTYFSLGFLISFVIPVIYVWLNIERASFFTEVV